MLSMIEQENHMVTRMLGEKKDEEEKDENIFV